MTISRYADVPQRVRALWAKSDAQAGHGLLLHMVDVACVAEAILENEPSESMMRTARALGLGEGHAKRWVATLVGLHDFGKAIPGFQLKWEPGADECRRAGLRFNFQHQPRHLVEFDHGRPMSL